MEDSQQEDSSLARGLVLAYLLLSVLYSAWMIWALIPEHTRTATRMRLLRSSGRATRALARRAGAASMGLELATGQQAYELPLFLSGAAARLERAYDRARDVTT